MTRPHPFRLIVFDVDGTLVDSKAGILAAMTRTFAELGLPAPDPMATRRVVGLSLHEAIGRLLPDDAGGDLVERAAETYRHAFAEERRKPDYQEPLFPDAAETRRALDHPQVCLGVATGKSRRGLAATLAHHGLDHHFVTLKTADDGPGKPDPHMLRDAMADVGAEPHETVLVGDTVYDMTMARRAGSPALGVAWGNHPPDELHEAGARHILERFVDLPTVLQELTPACASDDSAESSP
jgi:phosphoglycolate phosphatase